MHLPEATPLSRPDVERRNATLTWPLSHQTVVTFISCLSGHQCGATGFNLLRSCQSAFLSWPSYSGMFIQVYACLLVVCSEHHRVSGRANLIYVTQLFNTKPEVHVKHCGASEKSSLERCRVSETTLWLIHHFSFAWHILWKKLQVFFSPLEEGKASTLCPASERLIILIVFRQFAVEWKQFWVSQVKQLLCVKLRLRARPLCLDEMSTAGLRYVAPGPFVCSCPHWSKINCEAQRTAVVGDFRVAPHRPVSPRARYNNLKQPQPCGHAFALKIRQTEPPKS